MPLPNHSPGFRATPTARNQLINLKFNLKFKLCNALQPRGLYSRIVASVFMIFNAVLLILLLVAVCASFSALYTEGMWRPQFLDRVLDFSPVTPTTLFAPLSSAVREALGEPFLAAAAGGAMVGSSFALMLVLVGWRCSMVDMLRGALAGRPIPTAFIAGCAAASYLFSPLVPPRVPSLSLLVGGFLSGYGAILAHGDFTTAVVWGLAKPHHLLRPLSTVAVALGFFVVTTLAKRALAEACYTSSFFASRGEGLSLLCALRATRLPAPVLPTIIAVLLVCAFCASLLPRRPTNGRAAAHRLAPLEASVFSVLGVAAALACGALYSHGVNASGLTAASFRGALGLGNEFAMAPWVFFSTALSVLTLANR
jgi:hypothetical protein